ncbi:hypothetical protein ACLHDG_01500 [Sulfurovum sp. CS9]|uniref:hypothetical protein n=1 Tax=Sulfurovum sp. CS9 TaxID=3391146 RepID=UPI0039EC8E0A
MVKQFFTLVLFLVLLLTVLVGHYMTHDGVIQNNSLSTLVNITKLSSPSLSVAYYEPRVFLYDEDSNPAYPQMQTMNKMDLVYDK